MARWDTVRREKNSNFVWKFRVFVWISQPIPNTQCFQLALDFSHCKTAQVACKSSSLYVRISSITSARCLSSAISVASIYLAIAQVPPYSSCVRSKPMCVLSEPSPKNLFQKIPKFEPIVPRDI